MSHNEIPILDHIAPLAERYPAWLCDIWGVVHNGVRAFPAACEALVKFRDEGGTVVLITNAPRPWGEIVPQLQRLGVPREAYDAIITSGDVTRELIVQASQRTVLHIGPSRDLPVFDRLDVVLGKESEAGLVVCTGLVDDTKETPADYAPLLRRLKDQGLAMICANPDRKVERGADLVYCAGALADAYEALGGTVHWAGKPYPPIYQQALKAIAEARGAALPKAQVLAIGDGLKTDMAGAAAAGIDALFVPSRVHVKGKGALDPKELAGLFDGLPFRPVCAMSGLEW